MSRALFRYDNSNLYVDAVTAYAKSLKAGPSWLEAYHAWNVLYRWVEGEGALGLDYSGAS